jgi:Protein of unknown function (DUF4199)
MKKIVLRFGLISGFILMALSATLMPLCLKGILPLENQEVLGYTSMVLSFLLVFFGVRSYRESVGGGAIGFGKAFQVGILITLITCAMYVLAWEILYYTFLPDFFETYTSHVLAQMKATGASAEAVQKKAQEMASFAKLYHNPLVNSGVTFLEVFPVGLIVTLVSAAILRRKPGPGGLEPAVSAAS